MSVVNVLLTKREGMLCTDTFGYDVAGRVLGEVSKCIIVPHHRLAIATRGSAALAWNAAILVSVTSMPAGIDSLIPQAERFMQRILDASLYQMGRAGCMDGEVTIVGWSDAAGAPVGHYLEWIESRGTLFAEPIQPGRYDMQPRLLPEFAPDTRHANDPPAMFRGIANAQRKMAAARYPGNPVGGRLILTTVNRHGMEQRQIHAWPDDVAKLRAVAPVTEAEPA
ncbi:hypothetical protein [Niveispirillum sp. KHB5.9]|uniref:hypothetical protein n=1 Tax=Niveispirillum sp. KHB5.9 TaxID=3400269 RepID=UPI003A8C2FE3